MRECRIEGCTNQAEHHKTMCSSHRRWKRLHGSPEGWQRKTPAERTAPLRVRNEKRRTPGDTYVDNGYVRDKATRRYVHRIVIEQHLGRPLFSHENVHHKDGNRANNRLSNLELWSKKQPAGQRVDEKIEWALWILHTYAPEWLK